MFLDGYTIDLLMNAGIMAIVAVGLYITLMSGQFQAAVAAFMGIGAYGASVLTVNFGIAFPLAVLAGAALSFLIAAATAALTVRLRHVFMGVATFSIGQVLTIIVLNSSYLGEAFGFHGMPLVTTLPIVYGTLAGVLWIAARLDNSRYGQAFRALAEDELTAASLGINVRLMRVLAFALGSMIAGIGGGLYAHVLGLVTSGDFGFGRSLSVMVYVMLGGVTAFWVPLIGTYVLILLPEALRFTDNDRWLIYGIILVLLVLLRPYGFVPRWPIGKPFNWKEWARQIMSSGRTR